MKGMREVCSSCASWVEDSWLYCMQCGASRPLRPPVNLFATSGITSIASVYEKDRNKPGLEPLLAKERGTKRPSLVRRRQTSDGIHRQLDRWRRKSDAQETLLKDLEKSNTAAQRVAATKSFSELRRAVHEGREAVRHWSSSGSTREAFSPTIKAIPHNKPRKRRGAATTEVFVNLTTANSRESFTRHASRKSGSLPGGAMTPVDGDGGALRREHHQDVYYSPDAPHVHVLNSCHVVRVAAPTGRSSPLDMKRLGESPVRGGSEESPPIRVSSGISTHAAEPQRLHSGWFWGAGGYGKGGGGADNINAEPGEGAMGSFWRGLDAVDTSAFSDVKSQAGITPPPPRKQLQYCTARDPRDGSSGSSITTSAIYGDSKKVKDPSQPSGTINSRGSSSSSSSSSDKALMSVASAKAAVRSASNRAAELSQLVSEGNNAPREECLAKVESAVRAAQSAISCTNERLFEMELLVGASVASGQCNQDSSGVDHHAGVGNENGNRDHQPTDHRGANDTMFMSHMTLLAKQLELAQSLQAESLAAKATVLSRYAKHDAAATLLQAYMRGRAARSRTTTLKEALLRTQKAQTLQQQHAKSSISLSDDGDNNPVVYSTVSPTTPRKEEEGEEEDSPSFPSIVVEKVLPREAEGWWTLAEAENEDETGEPELALLEAVVKLQSIVRSRLARSKTIAAVNARFVEHFDEEYQYLFYVCTETNISQWNRPFGFGGGSGGVSPPSYDGQVKAALEVDIRQDHGGCEAIEVAEPPPEEEDNLYRAAVVVQCALRAARARRQFAEKIISASL